MLDGRDAFPLDVTESVDTVGDGTGDNADTDDDGDGVLDVDESATSIDYAPAEDTYASVAFEDLWPETGDYDFNDMIVDYRYTYYKTENDNTNVNVTGQSYKTTDNHPWAIHLAERFKPPKEGEDISHVYKKFKNWAQHNTHADWYTTDSSDYRNNTKIRQTRKRQAAL